jgi:hypothetical protein
VIAEPLSILGEAGVTAPPDKGDLTVTRSQGEEAVITGFSLSSTT